MKMIENKKGSESLVSSKLMIIILAVLVIAVILFFLFKADILEWMRNLPEWQYEGDKDVEVSGEDYLVGKEVYIEGVGKGKLFLIKGECVVFFEEKPFDFSKMEFFKINKYNDRLYSSQEGNDWIDFHWLVIEGEFSEFEKQKEAYDKLSSVVNDVIFKGTEVDEKKAENIFVKPKLTVFFKIDGAFYETFIKWEGKKWYKEEKEEWKPQNWDYEEAYAKIRKDAEGTFYDNEIYWKTKEDSPYELIPGMIGDAGEIDSVEDFYNFRVWFDKFIDSLEEKEKTQKKLFSEFKEEIEKRTINIDGKEEKLGIDYIIYPTYSLPLVYFSPENKKYGIIYKEPTGINHLWLTEYFKSEDRWKEINHPSYMWPSMEEAEDAKKATKIFNFLKQECPK